MANKKGKQEKSGGIELPENDIRTEEGQPTFKKALEKVLEVKPKNKP